MKYFVSSDIHGFFSIYMKALSEAGFDRENPEHKIIICGDLFDRGNEAVKLYKWIKTLPRDRRILIRGNHEYLFRELSHKKYPDIWDNTNGTSKTFFQFLEAGNYKLDPEECGPSFLSNHLHARIIKEIADWMFSEEWVNYFELDNLIFVHSFIPLKNMDRLDTQCTFLGFKYDPNWRNQTDEKIWENAAWGCPYIMYLEGYFNPEEAKGKTLVVGHWHSSAFYRYLAPDSFNEEVAKTNPIFKDDKNKIIALDARTVATGRVNVMVIEK